MDSPAVSIEPFDWQKPLVKAVSAGLINFRLFISGFPTGSGKTVISLASAAELGNPHLVIAPKVALTQWRRVAESMGCSSLLVDVINPEQIAKPSGCCHYTREGKWKLPPGTTVIWDEPHRSASGADAVSTRAMAELRAYKGVRLHAMSATLADSPLKLRALGWWAGLHRFNDESFYSWCGAHGCAMRFVDQRKTRRQFRFTSDPEEAMAAMAAVRREFGERFLSLKADDIPGFPSETIEVKLIDLEDRDREEVDAALRDMSTRLRSRARSDMAEIGRERERVEWLMADVVAELALAYAIDGNSVVVFFNFTAPRLRFEQRVATLGGTSVSVYGGQDDADRQEGIDAFQANRVHICSVMSEAGGAALSLHDELKQRPRVSLVMPSWSSSTVKQCFGRIRRCNGTHATQLMVLAAGTIQERVACTLQRKLRNLDTFNSTLCDEDLSV